VNEAIDPHPGTRFETSVGSLVDHVLEHYHRPLRRELYQLVRLAETICETERAHPSCPHGLAEHLRETAASIEDHLTKEERILFPMILAGRGCQAQMPIRVMLGEHEDHAANLAQTRALTQGLEPPVDASFPWIELYAGLRELESSLKAHIHFENEVLFPRALRA
jgi:regulator of cell morphogenesis and NO signaling